MDEEKEIQEQEDKNCEKCDEYLNGWKRALADYDNLKKELSAQRIAMRNAVIEDVSMQIIPVLDHFDQALKFKPEGLDKETEGWLQGIMHVRTQLEGVMREMGFEPFGEVGDFFDPHLHDAADEREQDGEAQGKIIEVLQRGWKHAERILRPAKVIVNK